MEAKVRRGIVAFGVAKHSTNAKGPAHGWSLFRIAKLSLANMTIDNFRCRGSIGVLSGANRHEIETAWGGVCRRTAVCVFCWPGKIST